MNGKIDSREMYDIGDLKNESVRLYDSSKFLNVARLIKRLKFG